MQQEKENFPKITNGTPKWNFVGNGNLDEQIVKLLKLKQIKKSSACKQEETGQLIASA